MTKWLRFLRFYVFFLKMQKKHDFLRFFEMLHTFSRTLVDRVSWAYYVHWLTPRSEHQCCNLLLWCTPVKTVDLCLSFVRSLDIVYHYQRDIRFLCTGQWHT